MNLGRVLVWSFIFATAAALIVAGLWLTFSQPDHGATTTRFQTRRGEVAEINSPSRGILLIFIGVLLLVLELASAGWALDRKEAKADEPATTSASAAAPTAATTVFSTTLSSRSETTAASDPPSGPCTAGSTVNLQDGCQGRAVEDLQQSLRDAGFGDIVVDGQFGTHTEAALRLFEATREPTTIDGQVSIPSDEWNDLTSRPRSDNPLVPSAQVNAVCSTYVTYGCTGPSAEALESILATSGLLTSEINDTLGSRGWRALLRAQSCLGNVTDGVIEVNGTEWQSLITGAGDGSLARCP